MKTLLKRAQQARAFGAFNEFAPAAERAGIAAQHDYLVRRHAPACVLLQMGARCAVVAPTGHTHTGLKRRSLIGLWQPARQRPESLPPFVQSVQMAVS